MADKAYCPDDYGDSVLGETVQNGQWRQTAAQVGTPGALPASNRPANAAMALRDDIADYFVSAEGALPWQLSVVRRK
ncbi:hypothetical protein HPB49_002957 [Dermacentor silvarum]|uniref:Uncharacterized protein n=1 Tax=Dermacentor silvarum TaxID=543639 RepID=A0ACB8DMM1_DERSI|nr:hypothetical protein HPB49_002957 [Dermacentor silvarum]